MHLACALLLLPPTLSPYVARPMPRRASTLVWPLLLPPSASSLPPPLPLSPWSSMLFLQGVWAALAAALARVARYLPHRLSPDALACACAIYAAGLVLVLTCAAVHLALLGSLVLSAVAAAGLPGPSTNGSSRTHHAVHVVMEGLLMLLVSPCALLLLGSVAASDDDPPVDALVAVAWQHAASFGALPYAFAVSVCTPMCAVAASLRIRRITQLRMRTTGWDGCKLRYSA